jgi:hypothetical protein
MSAVAVHPTITSFPDGQALLHGAQLRSLVALQADVS